jgi:hypothetical protein
MEDDSIRSLLIEGSNACDHQKYLPQEKNETDTLAVNSI